MRCALSAFSTRHGSTLLAAGPALRSRFRSGRSEWAMIAFLFGFAILIVGISEFYLLPALDAYNKATPAERERLVAFSRLLLAIVLLILFAGLMLTVRMGRFFFPRPRSPRSRTAYVDVWAEAGKRAQVEPKDRADDMEDPDSE